MSSDKSTQTIPSNAVLDDEPGRRIFGRAPIHGFVMIHDDSRLYIAPLKDLSAGGFFVGQLIDIPEGRKVRVVVKSTRLGGPIQASGTVVRIEGDSRQGTAIEFTSLSKQDKQNIQACVFQTRLEAALKVA